MATYNLGRFILYPKGSYHPDAYYNFLDVVLYLGSSYVCKSNNVTGIIPTNTTYWQLLAQAGQPTMTEQQKQEIIATLQASGVVIDSNYNTFTAEEKTKLAGLTAPNNGTLTLTFDGRRIGQFTANASGNTTVDVPNVTYDGVIKLVRADDPNVAIGSFSVNQKEDAVIEIPVGSGGGSIGTLTLTQGGSTLGTFNGADASIAIPAPNNGILTIRRNGTQVATFEANQSGNATANISVPVSVADLSDGQSVRFKDQYFDADRPSGSDDLETVKIDKLQCGTTYYCKPNAPTTLEVQAYDYDETKPDCLALPESRIVITPSQQFGIIFPTNYRLTDNSLPATLDAAKTYIITVRGFVWEIRMLQ